MYLCGRQRDFSITENRFQTIWKLYCKIDLKNTIKVHTLRKFSAEIILVDDRFKAHKKICT